MIMCYFLVWWRTGGPDSPPEPAPSEIPMRMNGGLRTLKSAYVGDLDGDVEHPAYHLQPGSGLYLQQGRWCTQLFLKDK